MAQIVNAITGGFSSSISSRYYDEQILDDHVHAYYELYYLIQGTARHFINNEIINITSGEIVIVKNGYIHKTIYEQDIYTKRLLICFDSNFIGSFYKNIADELGEQKYLSVPLSAKLETENMIKNIHNEFVGNKANNLEMCKNILRQLLILLHRHRKIMASQKLSHSEIVIQDASKYISNNFYNELSLKSLSEKYSMSDSHFSKTFKLYTGFGVNEYITLVRLNKAEEMLRGEFESITDVAYRCGYNDSNYFASVFKKYKGITPLKFACLYKTTNKS
ncbi:MAG: helix-turn-helix domain-containing protein [Ruminococcaceae bacterium]|nr:helix-turn-helix domain-containing protein [Oscillospiraceae bacterium]